MSSAPRFLVVDDEPSLRRIGARVLQRHGYECRVAASASEAIGILETEHIDVMMTDIAMPGMGGLELARLSRALYPRLAIVVITGHPDERAQREARRAGVDDFIVKPFHPSDFIGAAAGAVHIGVRRGVSTMVSPFPEERPWPTDPSMDALFAGMS